MSRKAFVSAIYLVVLLYLGLPIIGTLLFSLADKWDATVLPETYTVKWYLQMFTDSAVLLAIGRSLLVAGATVLCNLIIFVPAVLLVSLFFPRLQGVLRTLALLPFAFPGVILAVGLIQLYSSGILPIAGTFWILLFAYMIVCLPYMYNAVVNSVTALDGKRLVEAAQTLGAPMRKIFTRILLPNILPGVINGSILTFSVALGEFVLANMLVGGQFPTLQVILEKASHKDGHLSSAMVVLYFVIVSLASLVLLWLMERVFHKKADATGFSGGAKEG
jgi:putative spermidine/putrescine transport system permease protein